MSGTETRIGLKGAARDGVGTPATRTAGTTADHATPALAEADRLMTVCNSGRYCEGLCAVFPAMEMRRAAAHGCYRAAAGPPRNACAWTAARSPSGCRPRSIPDDAIQQIRSWHRSRSRPGSLRGRAPTRTREGPGRPGRDIQKGCRTALERDRGYSTSGSLAAGQDVQTDYLQYPCIGFKGRNSADETAAVLSPALPVRLGNGLYQD